MTSAGRADDACDPGRAAADPFPACPPGGPVAATRQARLYASDADGRPALLKIATAATMADPVGRARFAREGRVGLGLRHPHLVETLRCGEGWILLGDLRGPDARTVRLDDRVRAAGPLAPAEVEDAVASVAAALAHMHGKGLVHRDVKPGNILVAADGRPVLIDFGAVGFVAGDDLDGLELIGSPAWMAPEQIAGGPARPSADAWSLSAVAAYALAGTAPYAGTASDVLCCRTGGAGPSPDLVAAVRRRAGAALRDLILSGLADDPEARPPMQAFARLRP